MSQKGIDMKKLFSGAKVGALVALASAGALALPAQAAAVDVGDVVTTRTRKTFASKSPSPALLVPLLMVLSAPAIRGLSVLTAFA